MKKAERNNAIYNERKSGKTLQFIADTHGITRERVRQIVSKIDRRKDWEERVEKSEGVLLMAHIDFPKRVRNRLEYNHLTYSTPEEFLKVFSTQSIWRVSGFGTKSIAVVCEKLGALGYDVSDLLPVKTVKRFNLARSISEENRLKRKERNELIYKMYLEKRQYKYIAQKVGLSVPSCSLIVRKMRNG